MMALLGLSCLPIRSYLNQWNPWEGEGGWGTVHSRIDYDRFERRSEIGYQPSAIIVTS